MPRMFLFTALPKTKSVPAPERLSGNDREVIAAAAAYAFVEPRPTGVPSLLGTLCRVRSTAAPREFDNLLAA